MNVSHKQNAITFPDSSYTTAIPSGLHEACNTATTDLPTILVCSPFLMMMEAAQTSSRHSPSLSSHPPHSSDFMKTQSPETSLPPQSTALTPILTAQ